MPKVIFHDCTDGYLTEIRFEGQSSRLFGTIREALSYLSMFVPPTVCPQEIVKETGSKASVMKALIKEREMENASM